MATSKYSCRTTHTRESVLLLEDQEGKALRMRGLCVYCSAANRVRSYSIFLFSCLPWPYTMRNYSQHHRLAVETHRRNLLPHQFWAEIRLALILQSRCFVTALKFLRYCRNVVRSSNNMVLPRKVYIGLTGLSAKCNY